MLNQEYKVITLNVNGLQNPIKRNKLITKTKKREEKQQKFGRRPIFPIRNIRSLNSWTLNIPFYSSNKHGQARGIAI